MADCIKLASSLFTTSALISLIGCGTVQQSKFQTAFLPSPPRGAVFPADLADPPIVESNPYLANAPAIVTLNPQLPPFSRADAMIHRAQQYFERGKKFYQAKDAANARKQFDQAIDMMLRAGDNQPTDRQDFDFQFEQMVDSIHRYDLAGLGAALNIEDARFEKAPLEDILEMTFPVDPKLKDRVREQMAATVSQLPLSVNDVVAGYIHYFEGRGRRTLTAGFERAGRYRPMIQRILDEEGLPPELIHLAQAESGFIPRAVSRKQATGMWQFVAFRGKQYGLNQNRLQDDRLDPEKATRAAARHLHDLYIQFGDWYLAIAAYNCGPGVIERAVERTGYADFWELRSRGVIPRETTNYVPIILAMTLMAKNAGDYGLQGVTPDPPLEYDTIEITSPTHLALIADLTDAPLSELAALNPALLKGMAPEGYSLKVPKGSANTLMAALQMIPEERRSAWRIHKVAEGETLAMIGRRYGAATSQILAANRMESDPVAGDRLVIPAVYKQPAAAVKASAARTTSGRRTLSGTSAARRASGAKSSAARKRTGAVPASTTVRKRPKVLAHTAQNGQ
jgi:membrane-bound lytic murein transglycosylase D